jgi:hypothetical protein
MSLKSLPIPPVPEEVARVAHAVFPRGNVFMQVRDTASNHLCIASAPNMTLCSLRNTLSEDHRHVFN